MPPPPAAEPAMSGTTGVGGEGGLRSAGAGAAPPTARTHRIGARGRRSGTHPGGEVRGAAGTRPREEELRGGDGADAAGPRSGGGGPAAVPPVDGCGARVRGLGRRDRCVQRQGRRGCRPRRWASRPAPARRGSNLSRRQVPHRRSTSSSTPSSSPRAERWPAHSRHAPVQFHTQVQVSGAPARWRALGEALAPAALAPSLVGARRGCACARRGGGHATGRARPAGRRGHAEGLRAVAASARHEGARVAAGRLRARCRRGVARDARRRCRHGLARRARRLLVRGALVRRRRRRGCGSLL